LSELEIYLQPKQREFQQSIEDFPITFYGGAKGGGKSYSLRNLLLMRRFKYPGSTGAIFRKTFPELESNHIGPMFREFPQLRQYYNESKKTLTLPNTSILKFCYAQNEADLDHHHGAEYHDLGIDEAGQWTEAMFRKLQGSNRSSKPGIKSRIAITGNPGGIGHAWLKRIFVDRRFNERERDADYNFIQALVHDNPALIDNDPDYVHRLKAEPNEALRKAYLDGSWEIFAGQYFGELRREIHLIPPFAIPEHWTRFGAYDFGFNHPAAFGWFAVDQDGNVYLYREFIKAQMRIDQFAQAINRHDDTQRLYPVVAGWDCWAKKAVLRQGSPPTIAEEFLNQGISLSRAKIDRVQGATQLRNYLAWQGRPDNKPRLFIFNTCPVTYEAINRMQVDPDEPEDVLKQDATDGDPMSGDDAYDMIRYALMSRPMIADTPRISHRPGSQEWAKQEIEQMEEVALKGIQPPEEDQWGDTTMMDFES
jgi:phage terminase large subunit